MSGEIPNADDEWLDLLRAVERRCPRTFPHEPHGPWYTGEPQRPGDGIGGACRCPGVPLVFDRTGDGG